MDVLWCRSKPSNSNEPSPVVTYSNSGIFTVRLAATEGDDESSEIKSAYILVDSDGSSIDLGIKNLKHIP